jgi:glycosyltransferase involved in cell wall biosynthesis
VYSNVPKTEKQSSDEQVMRIDYNIAGTFNSGGMERVLANKANYLAAHGYEVMIVTTDQRNRKPFFTLSPRIRSYDMGINYDENNDKGFLNKVLHYPFKQRKHKKRLTKLLCDLRADIVISMFCNEVSFIAGIPDGSKKILEIHFSKFKRQQYGRKGIWKLADWWRSRTDEKTVGKFDKFVVLTQEDKGYWGGLPNMEVIANATNNWGEYTAFLTNKQVIAVGRYDYQKGFERLIEAWRLVYNRFPDWKLTIVGDGELRNELTQLIETYNLDAVIELKKSLPAILPEYLNASFLVMSSRYEGLPMVLLEAMSVGLPMVAFDCKCGPKDLITDGEDGFLVAEGNTGLLAERIMQLMEAPDLRKKMGQAAKIKSGLYAESAIMEKWMDLFNNPVNK